MSNEIAIIQQARNLPRVRELETGAILSPITAAIGKVFLVAGQAPKNEEEKKALKEDLAFMASELTKDIEIRFSGLTLEEIAIALEKGVRKDFGKYYGLNVVTFNDWISAYANSPERLRAIDEQLKKRAISAPTQPTTEQLKQMRRETIIFGFNSYKRRGEFVGNPTQLYKYLEELGFVKLTKDEKKDLMLKANEVLEKEYKSINKKDISNSVRDALKEALNPNTRSVDKLVFKAKSIAIEDFYKNIVEKDLDITELVK